MGDKNSTPERLARMEESVKTLNREHGETRDLVRELTKTNTQDHEDIKNQLNEVKGSIISINTTQKFIYVGIGTIAGIVGSVITVVVEKMLGVI